MTTRKMQDGTAYPSSCTRFKKRSRNITRIVPEETQQRRRETSSQHDFSLLGELFQCRLAQRLGCLDRNRCPIPKSFFHLKPEVNWETNRECECSKSGLDGQRKVFKKKVCRIGKRIPEPC